MNEVNEIISSSNYGEEVDMLAPRYRIESSHPYAIGKKKPMAGKSMATPFVTGVASLIMSNYPNLKAKEVREILKTTTLRSLASLNINKRVRTVLDAKRALVLAKERNNSLNRSLAMVEKDK